MLGILDMIGNYEERKVENTVVNDVIIDTARVTDCDKPYETAICSPHYNDGNLVIVEEYDDFKSAEIGHKKWVEIFEKELPETLQDVSTSGINILFKCLFGEEEMIYTKK